MSKSLAFREQPCIASLPPSRRPHTDSVGCKSLNQLWYVGRCCAWCVPGLVILNTASRPKIRFRHSRTRSRPLPSADCVNCTKIPDRLGKFEAPREHRHEFLPRLAQEQRSIADPHRGRRAATSTPRITSFRSRRRLGAPLRPLAPRSRHSIRECKLAASCTSSRWLLGARLPANHPSVQPTTRPPAPFAPDATACHHTAVAAAAHLGADRRAKAAPKSAASR